MTTYLIFSEGTPNEIEADSLEDAREQAIDLLRSWYPEEAQTYWVDAWIKTAEGETLEKVTTAIEPLVPPCLDDEDHDWQSPIELVGGLRENPGVIGHGGGVRIHAVCMRCRCERVTDTWAQRPDTGEEGLESVTYRPTDKS